MSFSTQRLHRFLFSSIGPSSERTRRVALGFAPAGPFHAALPSEGSTAFGKKTPREAAPDRQGVDLQSRRIRKIQLDPMGGAGPIDPTRQWAFEGNQALSSSCNRSVASRQAAIMPRKRPRRPPDRQ